MFFGGLFLSSILFYIDDFMKKSNRIIIYTGLAIPILLATFRGINVGVDTAPYYYLYVNQGSHYSSVIDFLVHTDFKEFLNSILIYFIYNYFNYNSYLFIYSVITIIFLYKALPYYIKDEIFLGLFIYLFMFYPSSLNIMRQMAAASIIFWGFKYILERKFIKFLLVIFLASGFHITSFIALPFYFVLNKNGKIKWRITVFLIIAIIFLLLYFNDFILFFSSLDESLSRYSFYVSDSFRINKIFFLNILIFIFSLLIVKINNSNLNKFSLLFLFFGLLFDTLGFISPFLKRFALYFNMIQVLLLSQAPTIVKKNEKNLVKVMLIFLVAGYYYLYYIEQGFAGLFPYELYIYPM